MQKQETKFYRITCKNKKPSFTGSHAKTRNQVLQDYMQKQETKFYRITCKNKKPSFTGLHAKTRNQKESKHLQMLDKNIRVMIIRRQQL